MYIGIYFFGSEIGSGFEGLSSTSPFKNIGEYPWGGLFFSNVLAAGVMFY